MDNTEQLKKLLALAESDSIYQLWNSCYIEHKSEFEAFVNAQPEHIRNFLWGYSESGRLIYQRLVNLACRHMTFPEENPSCAPSSDYT